MPEEEQQGYVQNFLGAPVSLQAATHAQLLHQAVIGCSNMFGLCPAGYANLVINFILGFFGRAPKPHFPCCAFFVGRYGLWPHHPAVPEAWADEGDG